MPEAPPLFSTTIGASPDASSGAAARTITSVTLPTAIGTISRIGRLG
jgi:hypothetical protein